eukprot:CAMPEP_0113530930 /NCGR_PEP_ID=MMETSP0015_2-20120614/3218_1 /TAXON_ID=2838 /ORGANISM="Odontella" /LENGTH=258 /DNA_ID=CAMNT_0000429717 /DNA_START=365 /DNA_END=1140 /DNA_ORIENTATION=- /assembly_acc=CAM_ASM_000160
MPPQCQMNAPAIEDAAADGPPARFRPRPPRSAAERERRREGKKAETAVPPPPRHALEDGVDGAGGSPLGPLVIAPLGENLRPFPPACRQLLAGIAGNTRCVDCGDLNPDWASVSFGALLCLKCSGHHRNLGVKTSFVRSVSMDHWSHSQILRMLEGGNHQLSQFFARHRLPAHSGTHRYRTVAARFYREKLAEHAEQVVEKGEYRGREHARESAARSPSTKSSSRSAPSQLTPEGKPRCSSAPRLEKVEEGRVMSSSC